MPHPAKKTATVEMSTAIVLQRPDMAALIGCIAAGWVHVEDGLEMTYAILSSYHMPLVEGFEPSHHPIARQVFEEVTAVKSRLDLVQKLCRAVVPDQAERFRKDVYDPMRSIAKKRNGVVHGHWGVSPDYPAQLIEMSDRVNWMVYDAKDLRGICDEIEKLNVAVQDFWLMLQSHRKERATHDRMSLGEFRNWLCKELWRKIRHGGDDAVVTVPKRETAVRLGKRRETKG